MLKRDVALLAYFVLTTWTCDRLDSLPLVWVTAPAPIQTGVLFQVLRFACRRVILAADPTLSGLRSLPMELRPTLLIEVPRLTHAIAKLLRATSRRGALANGRHVDLSCPRVVVARHAPPDPAEIGHPVEIALMPDDSRRPWIDLTEAERIAGEDLQERLEAYRLACLMSASPEDLDFDGLTGPMREIAHTLARCILDDDELRAAIVPLLKPLDREIHVDLTTRLEAILLEALLTLIHEGLTTASMAELTSRTNTILVGRGMAEQVSPETVGWRIRALGLHSEFIPGGRKGVALTDEMAAMIHRLAWSYGVRTFQAGNFDRNCRRCAVFFPSTGADGESVPVSS